MGLKLFYLSIHPLASTRKRMEKIWLKSYPGRTARRQPRAVPLCGPPAGRVLPQTRKSPFSVCMDRWMNYGELERLSGALGAYLQGLACSPVRVWPSCCPTFRSLA